MSLVDSFSATRARSNSTPKQVFAVWALVAAALAVWAFRRGWTPSAAAAAVFSIILAIIALRPPRLLAGFAGKAARFSDAAADQLSRIVLGAWYYLIFSPVAILWRLLRQPRPEDNGGWKDFPVSDACSFRKPF